MLENPRAKGRPLLKIMELPQPLLSPLQSPGHMVLQEEPESDGLRVWSSSSPAQSSCKGSYSKAGCPQGSGVGGRVGIELGRL